LNTRVDKLTILAALQKGKINLQGQFLNSSNYTFLAEAEYQSLRLKVVYKPLRGEQSLWDFPPGTLSKREVAAFIVSEALGWELVPPTVYRRKAQFGAGSAQQYIDHDPEYHYFKFNEIHKQHLRPVVLFDLVVNNADRKGGHIFFDALDHIWVIDHGICFHIEDKLRTVIWDFAGEEIPSNLIQDIVRLKQDLVNQTGVYSSLVKMISSVEINAVTGRIDHLCNQGHFPFPPTRDRFYPWPPI